MRTIKRFLFIIFCLLIYQEAEASKLISCINRPSGEICDVSMQKIDSSGTATTVFINQAMTEYTDPGGTARSQWLYLYGSDLDPAYEYYVYCHCQYDPGTGYIDSAIWSYNWGNYETRIDAILTSRAPSSTAMSNATWTDTKAGYLDAAVSSRSTLTAQQVWEYVTRTLTSTGGLTAQQVWEYATRELTGKTGFELISAYDPAKTCFQAANWIAPDNTNVGNIWTEVQTHPTLSEIEASTALAKEATLNTISANLLRGLGLMMENHVEDDIVRNTQGLKTASKFYLYDSKAHAVTHNKVTGVIATYTVAVTYNGSGQVTLFKVVKD